MKNEYFILKNVDNLYDIPCRIMLPDTTPTDVLVMCHGFSSHKDSRSINILSETLTKNNIICACFDFPEHGENHAKPEYFTINNCIKDLECFINYIKNRFPDLPLSIFGISFGGFITLSTALKNETDFKRRIFRAPAIDMKSVFVNVLLKDDFKSFIKNKMGLCGFGEKIELPFEFYEEVKKINLVNTSSNLDGLIFLGDLDSVVSRESIDNFISNNPNFQLKIIKNAEHRFSDEQLKIIAEDMAKYILE